jgi:hypothetical protein
MKHITFIIGLLVVGCGKKEQQNVPDVSAKEQRDRIEREFQSFCETHAATSIDELLPDPLFLHTSTIQEQMTPGRTVSFNWMDTSELDVLLVDGKYHITFPHPIIQLEINFVATPEQVKELKDNSLMNQIFIAGKIESTTVVTNTVSNLSEGLFGKRRTVIVNGVCSGVQIKELRVPTSD